MVGNEVPLPVADERDSGIVETVRRIDAKPGDRFVITVNGEITREIAAQIYDAWNQFYPDTTLLVMPAGYTLTVLGKDEECASSA